MHLVNWHSIPLYCFPPFSCIVRVIWKIINANAYGILVVRNWPSQCWYPTLFTILENSVHVVKPNVNQLYLPNHPDTTHPLFEHLELMACKVCGKYFNDKPYQKMWLIYLWSQGHQVHVSNILHIPFVGLNFHLVGK